MAFGDSEFTRQLRQPQAQEHLVMGLKLEGMEERGWVTGEDDCGGFDWVFSDLVIVYGKGRKEEDVSVQEEVIT